MNFKEKTVITLALLIVLVPYLGFPGSWESAFLVIAGLFIIVLTVIDWLQRNRPLSSSEDAEQAPPEAPSVSRGEQSAPAEPVTYSSVRMQAPAEHQSTEEGVSHDGASDADGADGNDSSDPTPSFLKW